MNEAAKNLTAKLIAMKPFRAGADFFQGESESARVLGILLNQRVGVDCATAVNLAIHDYLGRPFAECDDRVRDVTAFPYCERTLRASAKRVLNKVSAFEPDTSKLLALRVAELSSGIVGALAALERYANRANHFFDKLHAVSLDAGTLCELTAEKAFGISPVRLPRDSFEKQFSSCVAVLRMLEEGSNDNDRLRKRLLALDRVGQESADTLLLYVFNRPALIVDQYLRRIAYRHFAVSTPNASRTELLKQFSGIDTLEHAHALHARVNEIGASLCLSQQPDCGSCPLNNGQIRL